MTSPKDHVTKIPNDVEVPDVTSYFNKRTKKLNRINNFEALGRKKSPMDFENFPFHFAGQTQNW